MKKKSPNSLPESRLVIMSAITPKPNLVVVTFSCSYHRHGSARMSELSSGSMASISHLPSRIANSCGFYFSVDEAEKMERLRAETMEAERELVEQLNSVEEELLAPPVVGKAWMVGREANGLVHDAEMAVERVTAGMEVLAAGCGDYLRQKMVAPETVVFLAAIGSFQSRVRRWGQMRDVENLWREILTVKQSFFQRSFLSTSFYVGLSQKLLNV